MTMSSDRIEFEDDAPLELVDSGELEQVSKDEVSAPSKSLDQVFEKEKSTKKERNRKVKEKKPALKIKRKAPTMKKMKEDYGPKDYIVVECQICQNEYTHAKKDEQGAFIPFALCQHIVFKGVVIEE
jgi:hypothetical protein